MGVRSDVALGLTCKGADQLSHMLSQPEIDPRVLVFFFSRGVRLHDESTGAEGWVWVCKWYTDEPDDYPEVTFVEQLMEILPKSEYCFIRMDENGEREERGSFWDNKLDFWVVQEIHYNKELVTAGERLPESHFYRATNRSSDRD